MRSITYFSSDNFAMARKKVIDLDTYSALDVWAIGLQEMYRALRRAGFDVELSLAIIVEPMAYPRWILPEPVEAEKFGDYEDEDDD
jgi:hypothetical protein